MILAGLQLALIEFCPIEQSAFLNVVLVDDLDFDVNDRAGGGTAQNIQAGVFVAQEVGVNFPV